MAKKIAVHVAKKADEPQLHTTVTAAAEPENTSEEISHTSAEISGELPESAEKKDETMESSTDTEAFSTAEIKQEYTKIIKDKRMEAGKLMTKRQLNTCHAIIHTASLASGAAGFIPIPVADAVPISAAQVTMVLALGSTFGQRLDEGAAKGIIAAAASTFVGRNLVKLIPVAGWIASAAVAAGVTEAIGWTIATDMAKTYRKEIKST